MIYSIFFSPLDLFYYRISQASLHLPSSACTSNQSKYSTRTTNYSIGAYGIPGLAPSTIAIPAQSSD